MLSGREEARDRQFRAIDLDREDAASRYKLLTGTVVPRPIALVSTLGADGVVNLAPFSQFMIFAVNPGLLGFSVSPLGAGPKDTIRNLRGLGEMVINVVHAGLAEKVQSCAEEIAAERSEADHAGLELMPSELVRPPRVAVAPVQFECAVERMDEMGDLPNTIVVGRIRRMHIQARLLLPGRKIDTAGLNPLARLGGRNYCALGKIIEA